MYYHVTIDFGKLLPYMSTINFRWQAFINTKKYLSKAELKCNLKCGPTGAPNIKMGEAQYYI